MVRTTKQREDTQIEVSVDHQTDQYSVMVTSGASSRLEAVIAVPGSRHKELAGNRSTRKTRRADAERCKSPIKENRESALIGRHGVAGRRRDRESSCPPSFRTRPPESTSDRNSSFTPMDETTGESMMRRRDMSCPPDFQREAPDEILVSNRRENDSAVRVKSLMIFQKKASTMGRKPNLVTAVASNRAMFLSRVVGVKKRVVPAK
jgi:hypothetical protein